MDDVITEEISLLGTAEELDERFAKVIESIPRMYELIDSECVKDALQNPKSVILSFQRMYD